MKHNQMRPDILNALLVPLGNFWSARQIITFRDKMSPYYSVHNPVWPIEIKSHNLHVYP